MTLTPQREKQLIELTKTDPDAFSPVYEYYAPKIYAYVYNRIPAKAVAEEIVSIIFLAVMENLENYAQQANARFGSWIYRIAHNKVVDYFRSNQQKILKGLEENMLTENRPQNSTNNRYISELQGDIAYAILSLKPRYQEVLSLQYYADKSHAEIAEIMEIDKNHVEALLHRAHSAFREIFPDGEIILEEEPLISTDAAQQ